MSTCRVAPPQAQRRTEKEEKEEQRRQQDMLGAPPCCPAGCAAAAHATYAAVPALPVGVCHSLAALSCLLALRAASALGQFVVCQPGMAEAHLQEPPLPHACRKQAVWVAANVHCLCHVIHKHSVPAQAAAMTRCLLRHAALQTTSTSCETMRW